MTSARLLVGLAVLAASCAREKSEPPPRTVVPATLTQGLTAADVERFYHLPEGSELFPQSWFDALERKGSSQKFGENLERFGFLDDPESLLPVGLTTHRTADTGFLGPMVGLNCAACHVGEMEIEGTVVRVLGAPGTLDVQAFYTELAESALDTAKSPAKLARFVKELVTTQAPPGSARTAPFEATAESLEEEARAAIAELEALPASDIRDLLLDVRKVESEERGPSAYRRVNAREAAPADAAAIGVGGAALKADTRLSLRETLGLLRARIAFLKNLGATDGTLPGPGRVDAFGNARNFMFPEHPQPKLAPVSYPHLWGFGDVRWLHWDGNTTSVTQRNIGQAIGVGAIYNPALGHISTVLPRNLHELERISRLIEPLKWPGAIDAAAAARGRSIFEQRCESCHASSSAGSAAAHDVGTDPGRADSFAAPLAGRNFEDALREELEKIASRAFELSGISAAEAEQMQHGRFPPEWRRPRKYPARPLTGAWATAPYLHGGSVPTIADLLGPVEQRPKRFALTRRYDVVRLGLDVRSPPAAQGYVLDTSLAGNSNAGHEVGGPATTGNVNPGMSYLDESERNDLIEHLKTL